MGCPDAKNFGGGNRGRQSRAGAAAAGDGASEVATRAGLALVRAAVRLGRGELAGGVCRGWLGRASWAGMSGCAILSSLFFQNSKIHFWRNKNNWKKKKKKYRWIRYDEYFNMRPILGQKYELYKIKKFTYMSTWLRCLKKMIL
jgi:hypothetical protein